MGSTCSIAYLLLPSISCVLGITQVGFRLHLLRERMCIGVRRHSLADIDTPSATFCPVKCARTNAFIPPDVSIRSLEYLHSHISPYTCTCLGWAYKPLVHPVHTSMSPHTYREVTSPAFSSFSSVGVVQVS